MSRKVLVTGSSGFVGGAVVARLRGEGQFHVLETSRRAAPLAQDEVCIYDLDNPDPGLDLAAVDCVVHCAARVHVFSRESDQAELESFRKTNVQGTLALAERAAFSGVRRFIFVSTVKVNGEQTLPGMPFTASDLPAPIDPYGVSKHEAEVALLELAKRSAMEVVIIRPPLVYGPGVKANFHTMMGWLAKGIPLPLGCVENARSFVGIENLVDLVLVCVDHPQASQKVFLVSDGLDLSTPQLLRRLGDALGSPARLLPVPVAVLRVIFGTVGRARTVDKLCSSLQVDISATCSLLGWRPVRTLEENLQSTADSFLAARKQEKRDA